VRFVFGAVAAMLLAATGCSGVDQPGAGRTTPGSENPTSSAVAMPAIVGEWERTTTCEERVRALQKAGLGQFAAEQVAGEGWLPGVSSPAQIKDPARPCVGAVPLKHGHYFTRDGLFGSRDDGGDQVDDGKYRVVDQDTIVIEKEFGAVSFNYRIGADGALKLDPVMPDCAPVGCFAAQWAVAMAYPGLPWKRVS
jgi:hypothetical protein